MCSLVYNFTCCLSFWRTFCLPANALALYIFSGKISLLIDTLYVIGVASLM